MLKVGDRFVRYTPYGGVQQGRVVRIIESKMMDLEHRIEYRRDFIVTENGNHYCLDGSDGKIYRVHALISDKKIQILNKIAENMTSELGMK